MSSEQVRPVIECFCQILSLYGFSTITSETLRLAKFDQKEATIPLWRLVYEMMHFDGDTISQDFYKNKFNETPKGEIVDTIKSDLYQRGYTYDYFLSLDDNMQEGSRHLLVCVGWLIYHIKLIEKCMKQCLNSISNHNDTNDHIKCDLIEQMKQALHANSKMRSRLQAIEHMNSQDNRSMSLFESQLCQYPHLISQESVLDQPTSTVENNNLSHAIDCQHLEAEKQKFNAAIDTLDSALVRLEQLWISNNDHASIEHDVSSIVASIDKQISSLFNRLLNTNSLITTKSFSE